MDDFMTIEKFKSCSSYVKGFEDGYEHGFEKGVSTERKRFEEIIRLEEYYQEGHKDGYEEGLETAKKGHINREDI